MKIVTWNINSVRLRLDAVRRLVERVDPDILCLQETKVQDHQFPHDALADMGFCHRAARGMKSYNGVAILSKRELRAVGHHRWCGRDDARHLFAESPCGDTGGVLEVHCLYVPSGGDIPDPAQNEKFDHKLKFVDEMAAWFPQNRDPARPMLLVGDLNIAPLPADVWSHKQLLQVVSHTPVETEKLDRAMAALPWIDAMRALHPAPARLHTWWSYRARDWRASDRGRRLDHIWVSPALKDRIRDVRVVEEARGWDKPSDHAPVLLVLAE